MLKLIALCSFIIKIVKFESMKIWFCSTNVMCKNVIHPSVYDCFLFIYLGKGGNKKEGRCSNPETTSDVITSFIF